MRPYSRTSRLVMSVSLAKTGKRRLSGCLALSCVCGICWWRLTISTARRYSQSAICRTTWAAIKTCMMSGVVVLDMKKRTSRMMLCLKSSLSSKSKSISTTFLSSCRNTMTAMARTRKLPSLFRKPWSPVPNFAARKRLFKGSLLVLTRWMM